MSTQENKYKEEARFEKSLENGPAQSRSITDLICCLLFIIFIGAYIAVFFWGVTKGNPGQLLTPFDEGSHGCGFTEGFKNHDKVFFYGFQPSSLSQAANITRLTGATFCVTECPTLTAAQKNQTNPPTRRP